MCCNFRENLDDMFFDKTLIYFLCENRLIIIIFVLQCADKKWNFHYTKIKIIKWITVVVQNIELPHNHESERNNLFE